MRNRREAEIQIALCKYVKLKYPHVIFNSDMSGLNLSKAQAGQAKMMRSSKGFPDFVMYEPKRHHVKSASDHVLIAKDYCGLFIEIKKEGESLYLKTKTDAYGYPVFADDHIKEQAEMIEKLKAKGYHATFGVGLDQCMQIVDWYMNVK